MVTPIHELIRPHADGMAGLPEPSGSAGFEETERRVEELLLEWLRFYFSGNPFTTPVSGTGDVSKSLEVAEIFVGRSSPETPMVKPIIHTVIADRREDGGRGESGGRLVVTGEWTFNTFVRVAPQAPVSPASASSGVSPATLSSHQLARRVSSQFAWLLRSVHARDLVMKGVGDPRVISGPRAIQSGAWDVYQLVWSARVFTTVTAE